MKKESFIIIKEIEQPNGKILPVIMLDGQSTVWEFDSKSGAQKMADRLSFNSDSGWTYKIRSI